MKETKKEKKEENKQKNNKFTICATFRSSLWERCGRCATKKLIVQHNIYNQQFTDFESLLFRMFHHLLQHFWRSLWQINLRN